jgi:hypothetical protein
MSGILLSGVSSDTIDQLRQWSSFLGITPAEYVARLIVLHDGVRRGATSTSEGEAAQALARSLLQSSRLG